MGKKDTVTKEYMSENEIFADAFNYFLYDGRQKILGEQLKELDPTEMSIILENDAGETVQKFRDVLRQCIVKEDGKATYLLLGLENQSDLHYAMPVRNMIYDALNYGRQVQQIAARHRKKKDVKGAAFLSGMKKTDKLKPVVTLTLFWRADKWDAPRSLHEMLDAEEHILKFVEDYKLNLIVPSDIKDFDKFRTELGVALEFISISKNADALEGLSSNEKFASVSNKTVNLLNVCTGSEFPLGEKGGSVNMCEGLIELAEKNKAEGKAAGIIEGKVMAYFESSMKPDMIAQKLNIPLEEVDRILEENGMIIK